MEIKISEKNNINYETGVKKEVENTQNSSFASVLDKVKSNSTDRQTIGEMNKVIDPRDRRTAIEAKIDKMPAKNKGDVLFSIDRLNRIFGLDILGENGKYLKENLTIDFPRLLYDHGDEISPTSYEALTKYVNKLHDNGLVDDEDYFATLKWIAMKEQLGHVKVANEENKKKAGDAIFKSHEDKKSIL
jgi:hypothetical protein